MGDAASRISGTDPTSRPAVRVLALGLFGLGLLALFDLTDIGGLSTLWTRSMLTYAALLSLVAGVMATSAASGRIRAVRGWITVATLLWSVSEIVRDIEVVTGADPAFSLAHVPFAGVLVAAALAYWAALRGRLAPGDEASVYLDGVTLFLGTAAVLLTAFGAVASRTTTGTIDLIYAIFFLATTGATVLLDLAVLAERRFLGAYMILLGMSLFGAGFLWRLAAPPLDGLHEGGVPAYLLAAGVVVVAYGTVTWTDLVDEHAGYIRIASRLRSLLPTGMVAVTPIIMVQQLTARVGGAVGLMGNAALGLVLVTFTLRQSVMLRARDAAMRRQRLLTDSLTEAETKYRTLVERQPGVVYIAEPGTIGRWHYVSPQITMLLGYTPEEWLDDPALRASRIHPEDIEAVMAIERSAVANGPVERSEYRMLRRDGSEVWVLDDSSILRTADGGVMFQGLLLDITKRKRIEEALRSSEEQTRLIVETASYAFVAMDRDGLVIDWNQRAEATFGWTRAEAVGSELAKLIVPPGSRKAHRHGIKRFMATGEGPLLSKRIEVSAMHRDGSEFPVELTIWPVTGPDGVRFNSLIDDITTRKQLEQQLRHQALHDPLTGLANRTLFIDRVQHALERSNRSTGGVAVLFLDLDDFKTVNDSLGHTAGDALLIAVAERLRDALRPGDTPARLGGDEFAVLVEDVTDDVAQTVAARLLELFALPFEAEGKPVHTQASIGIAEADRTTTPGELLRNADLAMYMAKERGKGRYERYAVQMHEQALRKLDLKGALETAVAHDSLEVHYQPIISLAAGTVFGVEALLRWRGSDGQFVPLTEVIPLAEETGLINSIGRFVLRQACIDVRRWQTDVAGAGDLEISVNVSPMQLQGEGLLEDVRAALGASGLSASSLVLEITESAFIGDDLAALRALRRLRQLGLKLALDDFGTGYSSLSQLRHLQLDVVKIDRSFVSAIGHVREGALVTSIIDMGRSMGLELVAEGIETPAQLLALRARGCDLGQGRYFSMAVPADEMVRLLKSGPFALPRPRRRAAGAARSA